jgi:hypothetical protein
MLFVWFALVFVLATASSVAAGTEPPPSSGPLFSIKPTSITFGAIHVGEKSHPRKVIVTNITNSAQYVIETGGAAVVFGGISDCSQTWLNPGKSCYLEYQFAPTSIGQIMGSTNGTFDSQSYALSFTGTGLPSRYIKFTSRNSINGTAGVPLSFDVTTIALPVPSLSIKQPLPAGLSFKDEGNGSALISGDPSVSGTFHSTIVAVGPEGVKRQRLTIVLGPLQYSISPTTINFGSVVLGQSSPPQTVTVTNISGHLEWVGGSGGAAGVFGGTTNCNGIWLGAGGSCQIYYSFTPAVVGFVSGGTSGTFNGQPYALSFTGTGVPA